jgi:hypothetical protein
LLAGRLNRRGLVLSGGLLAVILSQNAASAGVSAGLVSSTVEAAGHFAAGQAGIVSAEVAALTEGVLKAMTLMSKLKASAVALLVTVLFASGVGITLTPSPAADAPKAAFVAAQDDKKDNGQQNQNDDGQKNNKDDGQKNDKDDKQVNNKDDGQQNQKEDVQKNQAIVKAIDREKNQLTVALNKKGRRIEHTLAVAKDVPVSLGGKACALKDLEPGMRVGLDLGKENKVVEIRIARANQKDDGKQNDKDDGQQNQKDDGQKNNKDDGQQNNKDDKQQNNKDDGEKKN